jgi:hypothetical protein
MAQIRDALWGVNLFYRYPGDRCKHALADIFGHAAIIGANPADKNSGPKPSGSAFVENRNIRDIRNGVATGVPVTASVSPVPKDGFKLAYSRIRKEGEIHESRSR